MRKIFFLQAVPYDLIVVQPFTATADPSVLGIKPIPNVQKKIQKMIAKYRAETIDFEDVEYEEADLEEDVCLMIKEKEIIKRTLLCSTNLLHLLYIILIEEIMARPIGEHPYCTEKMPFVFSMKWKTLNQLQTKRKIVFVKRMK